MLLNNRLTSLDNIEHDHESLLKHLVHIDSQIANHEGIRRVQLYMKSQFERLRFTTSLIENKAKNTAPLLFARKAVGHQRPTVTFIGHSDVVTKPAQCSYQLVNDRIYGSGVADDKGGLVVCLKAIENYLSTHLSPNININVVISPNEETGSIGFHDFFKKVGAESDYVLGLEPALHCGSVISSRNGNRWYQFHVKGIAAHAGRFGHNYINAAHKLSLLIAQMHELNDEINLRRVNVGSFSGGNDGFNTICGDAQAKIDVRFASFACRDYLHQRIEEIMQNTSLQCPHSDQVSRCFYSIEDDCPPLDREASSLWYENLLQSIARQEEKAVHGVHAGGAADINYFAGPGKKLLDGLGPIGGGLHTRQEYIERKSLYTRSFAIKTFLDDIHTTHFKEEDYDFQHASAI